MDTTAKTCRAAVVGLMGAAVVACASSGGGGPKPLVTTFAFSIQMVRSGGGVTGIDVKPNPPQAGLYDGGHGRLEAKTTSTDAQVTWTSNDPFWIKFEGMNSDKGHGAGTICERATQEPATWTSATGNTWTCNLKKGGGKTLSIKYHLADRDPTVDPRAVTLDPVIIVDR